MAGGLYPRHGSSLGGMIMRNSGIDREVRARAPIHHHLQPSSIPLSLAHGPVRRHLCQPCPFLRLALGWAFPPSLLLTLGLRLPCPCLCLCLLVSRSLVDSFTFHLLIQPISKVTPGEVVAVEAQKTGETSQCMFNEYDMTTKTL